MIDLSWSHVTSAGYREVSFLRFLKGGFIIHIVM